MKTVVMCKELNSKQIYSTEMCFDANLHISDVNKILWTQIFSQQNRNYYSENRYLRWYYYLRGFMRSCINRTFKNNFIISKSIWRIWAVARLCTIIPFYHAFANNVKCRLSNWLAICNFDYVEKTNGSLSQLCAQNSLIADEIFHIVMRISL